MRSGVRVQAAAQAPHPVCRGHSVLFCLLSRAPASSCAAKPWQLAGAGTNSASVPPCVAWTLSSGAVSQGLDNPVDLPLNHWQFCSLPVRTLPHRPCFILCPNRWLITQGRGPPTKPAAALEPPTGCWARDEAALAHKPLGACDGTAGAPAQLQVLSC